VSTQEEVLPLTVSQGEGRGEIAGLQGGGNRAKTKCQRKDQEEGLDLHGKLYTRGGAPCQGTRRAGDIAKKVAPRGLSPSTGCGVTASWKAGNFHSPTHDHYSSRSTICPLNSAAYALEDALEEAVTHRIQAGSGADLATHG